MWGSTANTKAALISSAIGKIDRVLEQHREVCELQSAMADAHRQRASELLAAGNRAHAAHAMRKCIACQQQVNHVEEVIAATSAHLSALQLTAVHHNSLEATGLTNDTLRKVAPAVEHAIEKLDTAAEMLDQVDEIQSAFASIAPTQSDDDAVLALLEARQPATPLPAAPTTEPVGLPPTPCGAPPLIEAPAIAMSALFG